MGILSVVILTLPVFAILAFEETRDSLVSSIGADSVHFAESVASSVDRTIYLKYHELRLLGEGAFAQSELAASNAQFDAMADPEGYMDSIEDEWTSMPSTETTPVMDAILGNNISECVANTLTLHYVEEHGIAIYSNVVVTNRYGAVVGMDTRTASYRQDGASWWPGLVEEGRYFGEIEFDPWLGVHAMPIAVKLVSSEGGFSGAIIGFLDIVSVVQETVYLGKPYDTTELQILRSDGRLIFSDMVFQMFEDVSEEAYWGEMTGSTGYFLSTEREYEKLFAYSQTSGYLLYPGNEWIVVVDHKAAEVLSPVDDLRSRVLTVAIPLLALSVALSYLFAVSISGRIRTVALTAREFSTGRRESRVDFGGLDEIGQLGESFNSMADELSELYDDLEGKVVKRTKEVEQANRKLRLLGSITRHDALNQVSIIAGWVSLAEESVEDEELLETLRKIREAAVNLGANLEFTGVYEKVGVKEPEWVQMDTALTHSLFGMGPQEFELHNGLMDLQVYCDPMIQKVLRNMVDNSVRHGGEVTKVSFSYREVPEGLLIVYEDDGVGLPHESKESVFEPGVQAGRKSYGLYLSKEILSITNITIRETGVPGKGARFEMLVPKGGYRIGRSRRKRKG